MSRESRDIPRREGRPCKTDAHKGSRESCNSYPLDPGTAAYITDGNISESTRNNSNQNSLFNFKLSIILDVPMSSEAAHFPFGQEKGSGARAK